MHFFAVLWDRASLAGVIAAALVDRHTDLRHWLHWISGHTGVPILLVAAVAIVVSWRVAKRAARLLVEVALVMLALVVATRLSWIHW